MTKEIKSTSMFSMDDAHAVLALNLVDAKRHLLDIVKASKANASNVAMTTRNIHNANSTAQLSKLVAGFILAHPSENLKVLG